MKSMTKMVMALVALAFVAVSCGKYEDGPEVSLLPKSSRMINDWVLDEQYIEGSAQSLSADDKDDVFSVQKDGKLDYVYNSGAIAITGNGTWKFNDSKEQVIFTYSLLGISYSRTFTILRLTSNEFWAEETVFTITTESHFISK